MLADVYSLNEIITNPSELEYESMTSDATNLGIVVGTIVKVINPTSKYNGVQGQVSNITDATYTVNFGDLGVERFREDELVRTGANAKSIPEPLAEPKYVPEEKKNVTDTQSATVQPPPSAASFRAYVVQADGTVLGFRSGRDAARVATDGDVIVNGKNDIAKVPTPVLLAIFNAAATRGGGKTVARFSDRATAERRVTFDVIEYMAQPGTVPTAKQDEPNQDDPTMATKTKKTATKKTATKTTRAPRTNAEGDKVITKLVDKNPRREGTHGFNSFAIMKNGMKVSDFVAKGGRMNDLRWDIDHKFVKIS